MLSSRNRKPFARHCLEMLSVFLVSLTLSGCSVNYFVDKLDPTEKFRAAKANVLTTGDLSPETVQELRILALEESFKEDPEKTLTQMEGQHVAGRQAEQALALAESAFMYANKLYKHDQRVESASYYLMAAAHCYDFLIL